MRLRHVLLATAAAAAMASTALAGQVYLTDATGYLNGSEGSGGAFIVHQVSGYNGELGGVGGDGTTFASFCIERNENLGGFGSGTVYNTVVSNSAVNGGLGGGNPDPIDERTALLYSTFRAGGNFGGTVGVLNTSDEISGLQLAIWRNEGEVADDTGYSGLGNPASRTVAAYLNSTFAPSSLLGTGNFYGVGVLRLYFQNGTNTQDQLTLVPTPQASLAGMSLLGVMGVMGVMKKRRKLQESELD